MIFVDTLRSVLQEPAILEVRGCKIQVGDFMALDMRVYDVFDFFVDQHIDFSNGLCFAFVFLFHIGLTQ